MPQGHQLILLSLSTNVQPTKDPEHYDASPPNEGRPSIIFAQEQKLYHVFSEDGMRMEETAYHVTNFSGFYPIWPIVEFSMTPPGTTKEE
jgi:hypothetical protein